MGWSMELVTTTRPSLIVGGSTALEELSRRAAEVISRGAALFVISDRSVWSEWGRLVADSVWSDPEREPTVLLLEPGEDAKSVGEATRCWEWLAAHHAHRDDVVVAVGGGVVGDLAGFVAATYLRGVDLWQVPTTLLAQVDSSVGGKVAVNLPAGKNLVGAFYQPTLVAAYPAFLSTLPPGEAGSGLGEVVKYALLSGESFLDLLEEEAEAILALEPEVTSLVVEKCVRLKAEVVGEDEREGGRRAILNLGHTIGHGLENVLGYGTLSHGAAVGLGLLVALSVSEAHVGLSPGLIPRVRGILAGFGLPTRLGGVRATDVLRAVLSDKKTTSQGLGFVCLEKPGSAVWGVRVAVDDLERHMGVITA